MCHTPWFTRRISRRICGRILKHFEVLIQSLWVNDFREKNPSSKTSCYSPFKQPTFTKCRFSVVYSCSQLISAATGINQEKRSAIIWLILQGFVKRGRGPVPAVATGPNPGEQSPQKCFQSNKCCPIFDHKFKYPSSEFKSSKIYRIWVTWMWFYCSLKG